MNPLVMLVLLPCVALVGAAPAAAKDADKTKWAAAIERECGLKTGTIKVSGGQMRFQSSGDESFEEVDCAVTLVNQAGVGKLGVDPNAILRKPIRYIAEGSSAEIAALVKAAQADKWLINKTAAASDGTTIVQFERGPATINLQEEGLFDRIWKKEFGDIAIGTAPRKLSDPFFYKN
jgi:hypothetical protein